MTHAFSFPYVEVLYTCHPFVQVKFILLIDAEINDNEPDEINILRAAGKTVLNEQEETELITIDLPDDRTREGAMFWELLREAGRNHFYKMQKAKSHEAAK